MYNVFKTHEITFLISNATAQKLKYKHQVSLAEIFECFQNCTSEILIDDRQRHKTFPPTRWFVSRTDKGRQLKVVFIRLSLDQIVIKTAYEADNAIKQFYRLKTRE